MAEGQIEGWEVVMETNSEITAELAKAYLLDAGITAEVFSQRDHALRVNLPNAQLVRVLVQRENADEAKALINELDRQDAGGGAEESEL